MHRAMKKLNSMAGNTLMMALLFLLVATVVSVVVLSGATAAARRVSRDRASQQAYLTLSSAAKLMSDCISGDCYKESVTEYIKLDESLPDRYESVVTEKANKELSRLLNEAVEYVRVYGLPYENEDISISLNGVPEVKISFFMGLDYSVRASLNIDEPGCEGYMTLRLDGSENVSKTNIALDNEYDIEKTETVITWGNSLIERGGD